MKELYKLPIKITTRHSKNYLIRMMQYQYITVIYNVCLATEIYKFLHDFASKIMVEVFKLKDTSYNFRTDALFSSGNFRTVNYGLQSMRYLAPKIWNLVPENIKESPSLKSFKRGIKQWVPYGFPCRLCRQYIPGLGFI